MGYFLYLENTGEDVVFRTNSGEIFYILSFSNLTISQVFLNIYCDNDMGNPTTRKAH